MNTFRLSLVMMALVCGSIYAGEKGKKLPSKRPGFGETIARGSLYRVVGEIIADKVCDEDEDFNKALIEGFFASLSKDPQHQKDDFSANCILNYGARKGTRYLNDKGVTLKAIGNQCDVIPKDWVTTRSVVNSTAKVVANYVTKPQFIAEVVKFGIGYYAKK